MCLSLLQATASERAGSGKMDSNTTRGGGGSPRGSKRPAEETSVAMAEEEAVGGENTAAAEKQKERGEEGMAGGGAEAGQGGHGGERGRGRRGRATRRLGVLSTNRGGHDCLLCVVADTGAEVETERARMGKHIHKHETHKRAFCLRVFFHRSHSRGVAGGGEGLLPSGRDIFCIRVYSDTLIVEIAHR